MRFLPWGGWVLTGSSDSMTTAGVTAPQADINERSAARRRCGAGGKANGGGIYAAAAPAARRTGRKGGEYNHITQAMLKEGGYFDMPIQVSAAAAEGLLMIRVVM